MVMTGKSQELLRIKLAVHFKTYMDGGNIVPDMEITRDEVVLLLTF
jgi:hypothetical protein